MGFTSRSMRILRFLADELGARNGTTEDHATTIPRGMRGRRRRLSSAMASRRRPPRAPSRPSGPRGNPRPVRVLARGGGSIPRTTALAGRSAGHPGHLAKGECAPDDARRCPPAPLPGRRRHRRARRSRPATTLVKPGALHRGPVTDSFCCPGLSLNCTVTIPFAFEKRQNAKRVQLFERAATVLRGEPLADKSPPGYPFDDSDVYKVVEGASYSLAIRPTRSWRGTSTTSSSRSRPPRSPTATSTRPAPSTPMTPAPARPAPTRWDRGRSAATSSTTSATCTRRRSPTTRRRASVRCSTWRSKTPTGSARPRGPGPTSEGPLGLGHQDNRDRASPSSIVSPATALPRPGRFVTSVGSELGGTLAALQSVGPQARRRAGRGRRPRRARRLHVLGHGRRGRAHRRGGTISRPSTASGKTWSARSSISPAASAPARRRGLRRRLRAAQRLRPTTRLCGRSPTRSGTTACSCCTPTRSISTCWSGCSTTACFRASRSAATRSSIRNPLVSGRATNAAPGSASRAAP